MASVQTTAQLNTARQTDHRSLLAAASRCYNEASRENNPVLLSQAADLAYQAWQADNNYIPGINLLARIAMRRGANDEAHHWLATGLSLKPESTGLLYSAGHLALIEGKQTLAADYFADATRISRTSTKAPIYLAHIRLLQGEYLEAFQLYRELIKTRSDDVQIRSKLFEAASYIVADFYSQELESELLRWFEFKDVDYNQLRSLTTSLLKHKLHLSEAGCPIEPETIASDPLLLKAMMRFHFSDPLIERLLITLRQSILLNSSRDLAIDSGYMSFVVALSGQIELNEAVWFISQQEQVLVNQLNQLATKILQITELKAEDISAIMLLTMMYQPLRKAPFYTALSAKALQWSGHLNELMSLCLDQPQHVAAAAKAIPSLGLSSNATSRKVKTQYEEHPYPRWTSLGYNQKTDYYASLQALFPSRLDDLQPESGPINVLVAGCGTGRHALRLVKYFHRMQVTAMDLSASALGYAQVQAEHHHLPVDFILGDILVSERLGQQFDVIESSGVLHHMESPEAGLKALVDVLKPGGIMKLALYSRQARTLISELRSELNGELPKSEQDIRTVREALLHQGEGRWRAILQSPDFYSMSSVRDLLFHTQEHTFDLQEIRRMIESADLEWVGIVPPPGAQQLAEKILRLPPANLTLNDWHTLEQIEPALFAGMYQFYVRKPACGSYSVSLPD